VGPIVTRDARVLAVARDHPLAERASVSVEDLPNYEVGWVDVLARETAEAYIPARTPNGRTISRRALAVNDVSEALLTIARSRVVLPTVSSFASASAHPTSPTSRSRTCRRPRPRSSGGVAAATRGLGVRAAGETRACSGLRRPSRK
jgi:hypothetical protein